MKLLVLSHDYGPGANASGLIAWRLVEALAEQGAELAVIYASHFPVPAARPGVRLYPCSARPYRPMRAWQAASDLVGYDVTRWAWCWRAARLCAQLPGDLIYAHSSPLCSLIAGAAAQRRTGRPLVLHFADPFPPPPAWLPRARERRRVLRTVTPLCAAATGLTFVCRQLRDYQERLVGLPLAERSEVFPNLLIPWTTLGARARGAPPVFLYVGSFYGHRRPDVLIAAFARLLTSCPEAELHIAGGRSCRQVASLLVTPALAAQVRLLGQCPAPLVPMRAADVLITLDAPDEEPVFLPSKLSEYLATDRVVLCAAPPGSASAELLARLPQSAVVVGTDPDAIATGMARAAGMVWTDALAIERRTALDDLTAPVLTRRLLAFCERCRTQARPGSP